MNLLACCLFIVVVNGCTTDDILTPESEKIVNGETAPPGEAPYQVSLQTASGDHLCAGVILNSRWIVTAAHCVESSANFATVLTGTQNLKSGGKPYQPEAVFIHPTYNKPTFYNDIALIKLETPIEFDETTKPIDYDYKEIPEGTVLTMTGWGRVSPEGAISDELQTLKVKYVGYDECKSLNGESSNVDFGHVCTMSRSGKGACHADSGDPLTYNGKLVAIVNWGRNCGMGYPDAHARISYYHEFIRTTIDSNE